MLRNLVLNSLMLSKPPKLTYRGLTIIMSNPSRFDTKELLSGNGGYYFDKDCLQPDLNINLCDVRLIDDQRPLLPNTKAILLMGEKAHRLYTGSNTTIDEHRGSPIMVRGIPCISSFTAQDCMDFKNYEKNNNPHYQTVEEFLSDEIAAGEIISTKGRGKTSRSNYKWWLTQDTKRAIKIVNNGGVIPSDIYPEPNYHIRSNSNELIQILRSRMGDTLHIDIETDFLTLDIRCISFAFESNPLDVYVFPVLGIDYKPAYDNLFNIIRALAYAFQHNTVVAHNGALFDFFVFAFKYHIPTGRKLYDTMVAQHRIYPDVEKSLGHCMSLHTWQPFHKNEGNHSYRTPSHAEQLMYYCGKDVYGMMLVKKAQEKMMEADAGLKDAINWSNRAIRPYLIQSYLGMKYNEERRQAWIAKNSRLMIQYLRVMKILMGTDDIVPLTSNKKCCAYFHDDLGYKVVSRSAKTGGASLKEEALLKLKQLYPENLCIDFLIRYRGVQKEIGTLQFKPWLRLPTDVKDYSETIQEDTDDED